MQSEQEPGKTTSIDDSTESRVTHYEDVTLSYDPQDLKKTHLTLFALTALVVVVAAGAIIAVGNLGGVSSSNKDVTSNSDQGEIGQRIFAPGQTFFVQSSTNGASGIATYNVEADELNEFTIDSLAGADIGSWSLAQASEDRLQVSADGSIVAYISHSADGSKSQITGYATKNSTIVFDFEVPRIHSWALDPSGDSAYFANKSGLGWFDPKAKSVALLAGEFTTLFAANRTKLTVTKDGNIKQYVRVVNEGVIEHVYDPSTGSYMSIGVDPIINKRYIMLPDSLSPDGARLLLKHAENDGWALSLYNTNTRSVSEVYRSESPYREPVAVAWSTDSTQLTFNLLDNASGKTEDLVWLRPATQESRVLFVSSDLGLGSSWAPLQDYVAVRDGAEYRLIDLADPDLSSKVIINKYEPGDITGWVFIRE